MLIPPGIADELSRLGYLLWLSQLLIGALSGGTIRKILSSEGSTTIARRFVPKARPTLSSSALDRMVVYLLSYMGWLLGVNRSRGVRLLRTVC